MPALDDDDDLNLSSIYAGKLYEISHWLIEWMNSPLFNSKLFFSYFLAILDKKTSCRANHVRELFQYGLFIRLWMWMIRLLQNNPLSQSPLIFEESDSIQESGIPNSLFPNTYSFQIFWCFQCWKIAIHVATYHVWPLFLLFPLPSSFLRWCAKNTKLRECKNSLYSPLRKRKKREKKPLLLTIVDY